MIVRAGVSARRNLQHDTAEPVRKEDRIGLIPRHRRNDMFHERIVIAGDEYGVGGKASTPLYQMTQCG